MPTIEKIEKVLEITQNIKKASSVVLFQYQGLTASDLAALRAKVKENGGVIEVIKNSLLSRAINQLGIKLPTELIGPTAVVFCQKDEITPLKEIEKIRQDKEVIEFKYGIYEQKLLTIDQIKTLINLPSKSILLSQLTNNLINPLQRLIYTLSYNQTQLILALKMVTTKN